MAMYLPLCTLQVQSYPLRVLIMSYGVTRGYPVTVSTRFTILDLSNFRQALNCLEEVNQYKNKHGQPD